MREDHLDIQTPMQERLPVYSNRKAKAHNALLNKQHHQHQKNLKKNLGSTFSTPITEDDMVENTSEKESVEKISSVSVSDSADINHSTTEVSLNSDDALVSNNTVALQHPEESIGDSLTSEAFIFEEDQSSGSLVSYVASLNQLVPTSPVTPGSIGLTPFSSTTPTFSSKSTLEMTPPSSTITSETAAGLVSSVTHDGATGEETNSLELESLVKHLRLSMCQVLQSADIDPQYKKLLDALVKVMIKEFYGLHEERGLIVNQLFSRKLMILLLTFLLFVLAGFMIFSDARSSYDGLPPT